MTNTDTSLMGRDAEQRQLAELLTSGVRWITVVGPVGVGKSALARVVADGARAALLFDVVLMEAAELSGERDGPALLLLDDADGELASVPDWLAEHPELTVLATARQAAGAAEERVVELAPLQPDAALELFLARAKQSRPGYQPTETELGVLRELVAELDGLPLAIELCAPRLSVMGPAALLHRVRQTRGVTQALDRALQSAWQSLSSEEQATLGSLSVFPGSFDLDAAEAVLLPAEDAVDRVAALRARSWIASRADADGEVRLELLGCVRRFVRGRADAAELRAAERAHAAHYAALAARADARRIALERANLDAVITSVLADRPVTRREAEPALGVLVALYYGRGAPAPIAHLAVLDPVLERTRDSGAEPVLVAQALIAAGAARGHAGDAARALRDLARGAELGRVLGRDDLVAAAQLDLAEVLLTQLEVEAAKEAAEAALAIVTARGDVRGEARALYALGRATRAPAVLERAAALLEDASAALHDLARVHIDAGDHAAAEQVLSRAPSAVLAAMLEHDRTHAVTVAACRALGGDSRAGPRRRLRSGSRPARRGPRAAPRRAAQRLSEGSRGAPPFGPVARRPRARCAPTGDRRLDVLGPLPRSRRRAEDAGAAAGRAGDRRRRAIGSACPAASWSASNAAPSSRASSTPWRSSHQTPR